MSVKTVTPLLFLAVLSSLPALAAQRAFVSSTGNDANGPAGCTLAAHCRSFQTAHNAVDAGGEIVALDTAGYGAVTISKSVTIMANPGVVAGISVGTGDGVTIATPEISVILRGLAINNVGTGTHGINMTGGTFLMIENCIVSRFGVGAAVATGAMVKVVNSLFRSNGTGMRIDGGATADVVGSQFLANSGAFGFSAHATADTVTTASISDSVASGNFAGFVATTSVMNATVRMSCTRCTASNNVQNGFLAGAAMGGTTVMVVSGSKATFNGQAGFQNFAAGGTSTFASLGDNTLYINAGGDTSGIITPLAGQ